MGLMLMFLFIFLMTLMLISRIFSSSYYFDSLNVSRNIQSLSSSNYAGSNLSFRLRW